jgi:hypothetical protein
MLLRIGASGLLVPQPGQQSLIKFSFFENFVQLGVASF